MLSTLLGPLCALASSFTWAIGTSQYAAMAKKYSPFAINFNRALVAFPLFILIQGFQQTGDVPSIKILWFLISVIASFALGDALFLWSTRTVGAPSALAIASTYPLWSALAGRMFRHEVLTDLKLAGLFLAVGGMLIVILSGNRQRKITHAHISSKQYFYGIALACVSSLMWALNAFAVAQGGEGLPASVSGTYRVGFALLLCPLMRSVISPRDKLRMPLEDFLKYLWIFILEGFGGAFLFMYALAHTPLAVGAALSSLAPVISAPLAWVLKTEKFNPSKMFGILLVVLGSWCLVYTAH